MRNFRHIAHVNHWKLNAGLGILLLALGVGCAVAEATGASGVDNAAALRVLCIGLAFAATVGRFTIRGFITSLPAVFLCGLVLCNIGQSLAGWLGGVLQSTVLQPALDVGALPYAAAA